MKFDNIPVLNHMQVANLIAAVGHKRTVLVQGENGVGKTSLLHTLKAMPRLMNHYFPKPVDCAQLDMGDHIIPFPDTEKGVSRGLPNERYGIHEKNQKGVNGARPVVICFDELAKAPKHIQASIMPMAFDRRAGSYEAPDGSIIIATTNLAVEGLGDFMLAHTRSRLIIVTMRKPTKDEWVQQFAIPHGLAPEIIAGCEQNEFIFDSFLDYESGGKHAGKTLTKENPYIFNPRVQQAGYISPRTLHAASDLLLNAAELDPDTVLAALGGTLGAEGANMFDTYIRFGRELPPKERIIAEPEDCPLPTSPVGQIVMVYKLVTCVNDRTEAEAVAKYVKRMKEEMVSLFCHTVASNADKISKFASLTMFKDMLREHRIFFSAGNQ